MLIKIMLILFIIVVFYNIKNLFENQDKKFINSYKEFVKNGSKGIANATYLIIYIIITLIYIIFFIKIGKINDILMWFSAFQIILLLKTLFSNFDMLTKLSEGNYDKIKFSKFWYKLLRVIFNLIYIVTIFYYMIR